MRRTRRYLISLLCVVAVSAFAVVGLTVLDARPKLGLDLQGGLSVVLTAVGDADTEVLDQTVEVIRNRVDSIGATEPDIARSGEENIIVQLPGVSDPERALEIIGKTAQLRFREVLDTVSLEEVAAEARREGLREGTDDYQDFVEAKMAERGWELTPDDLPGEPVVFAGAPPEDPGQPQLWYRLGPAEVQGADIGDAFAQTPQGAGTPTWAVQLDLTGDGTDRFAEVTTRLAPQQGLLAIVLDRRVESAPAVQQPITDGIAQITGNFGEREAKDLALVLRTGALPIELERSQVQQVSAVLGDASLRAGLLAGAIGLALVMVYMLALYRLLGLITLIGLGFFAAIVLGIIGLIGVTRGFALTLAGIAGLIVSVGIAADSYIIYFERIKDELRDGKTFRSAVDRGFRSAFRTNLTGNAVAFAAAIILWLLAIGPVRGFALTLGISALLDIVLLYVYTHPAVALIAGNRRLAGLRAFGMREAAAAKDAVPAR
jgi:protein-export membrane protein SecD